MITNRDISSRALLEEALDELVESASENGVSDEVLAEALRVRASEVDESGDGGSNGTGSGGPDDPHR
ncbi:hypothetical protein [Halobaculum gomorrense]|uniref:Uncharacterized protein n=1 Tax=Halobaculum gomorrense TaxID=43928 RepID=A0A1M5ULV2_9EURY|nr:hypothetical protein [Halobaculum gomorrense]SHH63856.1 hypothetical protein SAMN05443636_3061 [Halobaculum gomorrense]